LQEQLLLKDLPEAQKYCTVDFEYTLAKGRSRYVCIRNLIISFALLIKKNETTCTNK
jgi:Rad3-related DNA helicase